MHEHAQILRMKEANCNLVPVSASLQRYVRSNGEGVDKEVLALVK
jgi:hypothetical protein